MSDDKFLTPEEVSQRYRGEITVGTLRNWRAMRIGPTRWTSLTHGTRKIL
jgi:hypothetical protein